MSGGKMQSDPSLAQAPQAPKKFNFMNIVVVILALALVGVGFWGFQQSSALMVTQSGLATLQGKYDSLTAEKTKLSTDLDANKAELDTTKAELEKTKGELTTAQSDLTKLQDQSKALQAKIDAAGKKAQILYAFSTVKTTADLLAVDALIKASNDKQMQTEWSKFMSAPTAQSSADFLLYLMASVRDALK
jgi:predicted nuclease with TOPRIM domain